MFRHGRCHVLAALLCPLAASAVSLAGESPSALPARAGPQESSGPLIRDASAPWTTTSSDFDPHGWRAPIDSAGGRAFTDSMLWSPASELALDAPDAPRSSPLHPNALTDGHGHDVTGAAADGRDDQRALELTDSTTPRGIPLPDAVWLFPAGAITAMWSGWRMKKGKR